MIYVTGWVDRNQQLSAILPYGRGIVPYFVYKKGKIKALQTYIIATQEIFSQGP